MGPELLERDQELNRLRVCLAEATAGTDSAVLLSGEAGVGKTQHRAGVLPRGRGGGPGARGHL